MTTDRIAEIRRRELAATDGPWLKGESYHDDPIVYSLKTAGDGTEFAFIVFVTEEGVEADAEFAAHARDDIPFLLAALDQMTGERDELQQMVRTLDKAPGVNQVPDCENSRAQQAQRVSEEL